MVELEEASNILRLATPRSFVILDELGRGNMNERKTIIFFFLKSTLYNQINFCFNLENIFFF